MIAIRRLSCIMLDLIQQYSVQQPLLKAQTDVFECIHGRKLSFDDFGDQMWWPLYIFDNLPFQWYTSSS